MHINTYFFIIFFVESVYLFHADQIGGLFYWLGDVVILAEFVGLCEKLAVEAAWMGGMGWEHRFVFKLYLNFVEVLDCFMMGA